MAKKKKNSLFFVLSDRGYVFDNTKIFALSVCNLFEVKRLVFIVCSIQEFNEEESPFHKWVDPFW